MTGPGRPGRDDPACTASGPLGGRTSRGRGLPPERGGGAASRGGGRGRAALAAVLGALAAGACAPEPGPGSGPDDVAGLIVEATIPDVHRALLSGRLSCRDVVRAHLARIRGHDAPPEGPNAVTVENARALERADSLDRVLAEAREAGAPGVAAAPGRGEESAAGATVGGASGETASGETTSGDAPAGGGPGGAAASAAGRHGPLAPLGRLFCVPMLVKDNYDTRDMVTTGGSAALRNSVPPDDAFMVRRIRAAGAVVVAKTNMAEWAFSPRQTVSSSFDTTANAYALDRVPAGSSGGTASGVAASFGLAGLGTDTGNSIRGPSSHLALFGIRSTLGLTSRDGVIPLFFDRDVAGPMTRTVADGARVFDVVAGHDPADPYTELGKGRREADYTAFLDADGLQGARVGVLRALADPSESDSSVLRLFDRAVEDLRAGGAEIVDPLEVPELQRHLDADLTCPRFRYDMARYLESLGPDAPIRDVKTVLETGRHAGYVEESLRSLTERAADVHPADWETPCPDYADHEGRQAFLEDVVAAMDRAGVDALVHPTWTWPPAHLDRAREEYRGDNSQLVAPGTGMPAVTVPMGFSHGRFPAGLQILARPYDEGLLFRLAYAYEQATGHRRPPEGYPPVLPRDE